MKFITFIIFTEMNQKLKHTYMLSRIKYLLFLLFLFSIEFCVAQNLNLADIKYIYSNHIEKADEYITKRGFEFHVTEVAQDGRKEYTNWAYKRNNFNNRAKTFITKSCHQAKCGFVSHQFISIKHFNSLKDFCKKTGYKLVQTQADELGYIDYIYSNKIYEITFSAGLDSDGYNLYVVNFNKS